MAIWLRVLPTTSGRRSGTAPTRAPLPSVGAVFAHDALAAGPAWKRQKRDGDGLPKRVAEVDRDGDALVTEAKGSAGHGERNNEALAFIALVALMVALVVS